MIAHLEAPRRSGTHPPADASAIGQAEEGVAEEAQKYLKEISRRVGPARARTEARRRLGHYFRPLSVEKLLRLFTLTGSSLVSNLKYAERNSLQPNPQARMPGPEMAPSPDSFRPIMASRPPLDMQFFACPAREAVRRQIEREYLHAFAPLKRCIF